ncbi:PREDICTED: DNA topoisomerase 2-binding protein 1-A [Nicrophorus vespilloides]|uniref:DNA topoisomerase 2-binding protein 1-A n=1 Tax=Nicrophorus vespilloides TaxID=110193 RepID=A0ABM1NCP5_NICVS|nr:PREDICTED: DNA topoisomerase 2-binding protein 1-A [Nicrophorus vespilloides]
MSQEAFKVTFIIPEELEDETQTSDVMQQCYSRCKTSLMKTNWVREGDAESIDLGKTDFLVFQEFKGIFYEAALKTKSVRILGPLCLQYCIDYNKPIPNVDWPLRNIFLDGCIVVCSNLKKEMKNDIQFKIQAMGGYYTQTLVPTNTHLITDSVQSEKYHKAAPMGMQIMLPSWVDVLWDASIFENIDYRNDEYNKHKCPIFNNLKISATGITSATEKEYLMKVIKDNGGHFSKQLVVKNTDLLICSGSTSEKYKAARKNNIVCVTADWVFDSIAKGYAIPEVRNYSVKKGTSTPTKGTEFMDPDFSMMSQIVGLSAKSLLQDTAVNTSLINSTVPNITKKQGCKQTFEGSELVDSINMKAVKKAGPFLDGCNIYLAGFTSEQREILCKVLNFSGATRYDVVSERITHIVVGDNKCHELKLIIAKDLPCAVVSIKWMIDSMENMQPVPEDQYLISILSSPSTENGSPLSKKGLRLLKADVSMMDIDNACKTITPEQLPNETDEIMMQYKLPIPPTNNENDSLAALLALNSFNSKQFISMQDKSKLQDKTEPACDNSEPSTSECSITMEDTNCTNIFIKLKFLIVTHKSDDTDELIHTITKMGGIVVPNSYKGIPDYVIVPTFNPEVKHTATEVVTDIWINACYEYNSIVEIMYYHRPIMVKNNHALEDCVIAVSGFDLFERLFLKLLCEKMGAVVQDSLSRVVREEKNILISTHLISIEESGKKYDAARKWGLPILKKDWVLNCALLGQKTEEKEYMFNHNTEMLSRLTDTSLKSAISNSIRSRIASETASKLNISINKLTEYSPKIKRQSTSQDIALDSSLQTPKKDINKDITNFKENTPNNRHSVDNIASQITPVNQILQKAWGVVDNATPNTPKPWDYVDTPTSPLGCYAVDDPPPETRKKFARWLDGIPEPTPTKDRRLSTPLTELKKKIWSKFRTPYCSKLDFEGETPPADEPMDTTPVKEPSGEETSETSLVNEKLQQLQDMIRASGGTRRSSTKKLDLIPVEAYYEKESQPLTVGWDDNMEIAQSNVPETNKPLMFMISGVEMEEREELVKMLEMLGIGVSELTNYDPSSTHLICPKLSRNEKLLASMAAGKWVLHTSYVQDSAEAGKLLDEEKYEFGNSKCLPMIKVADKERAECVHYWRKEITERGYGAFHDMRAIVVAAKKEPIVRVIEAGDGLVVNMSPPFTESVYATHCLLEQKSVTNIEDYAPLAKQGILCLTTFFVNEYLHRTKKNIQEYVLLK